MTAPGWFLKRPRAPGGHRERESFGWCLALGTALAVVAWLFAG